MDINSVTIIGRLTRDAALTYTPGGSPLLKFGIALNKRIKRTVNGRQAEVILVAFNLQIYPLGGAWLL